MKKVIYGLVIGLIVGSTITISNADRYTKRQNNQIEITKDIYTKLKSIDKYLYEINRKLEIENQQY